MSCKAIIAIPEFLKQTPAFRLEVIKGDQVVGYLGVDISGEISSGTVNLRNELTDEALSALSLPDGVYALRFAIDMGEGMKPLSFSKYERSTAILTIENGGFTVSNVDAPVVVEFENFRFNGLKDLVKGRDINFEYEIVNPTDKNVYMSLVHYLYNVETGHYYSIYNANATAVASDTTTISYSIAASRFANIPDGTYSVSIDERKTMYASRNVYHDPSITFKVITPSITDGTFTYIEDSENPDYLILVGLKDNSQKLGGDIVIPGQTEIDGTLRHISKIMPVLSELIENTQTKTLCLLGPVKVDEGVMYHKNITEVEISGRVTEIESLAFSSCSRLRKFTFTEGIEPISINPRAFENSDIDTLYIDREIQGGYFSYARPVNVIYGNTVKSIPDGAFMERNTLQTVRFGGALRSIGDNAFYDCDLTGDIILPPSVETIGQHAFTYNRINNVVLGHAIKQIGSYAFCNSETGVTDVTITAPIPPTMGDDAFLGITGSLHVLASSVEDYRATEPFIKCDITPLVEATSIRLVSDEVRGSDGKEFVYHAILEPADATLKHIFWTSDDITRATVNLDGYVTFRSSDANVAIKAASLYAGIETDMAPTPNIQCRIDYTELTIDKYTVQKLNVDMVNGANTDFAFAWTSSDPDIVSVSKDGTIKALRTGQAVITVTATNPDGITLSDRCTVTVNPTFGFEYDRVELDIDQVLQLPIVDNDSQTTEMITYTSSDTDVAYVNMSGLLVSMGIEGKCTVTASRDNESYNLKVIVSSEAALIQPLPEGLNYTTDASTKTLTIEYSPEAQGEIVIPAKTEIDGEVYTITELGLRAFADAYSRITSIYVPNTVTKIGKHAFIHCDHLTYLHIYFRNDIYRRRCTGLC